MDAVRSQALAGSVSLHQHQAGEALLESILDDSNVARAFIKDSVEYQSYTMISTLISCKHWFNVARHHGDETKPPNATMVGLHLKALARSCILQDNGAFRMRMVCVSIRYSLNSTLSLMKARATLEIVQDTFQQRFPALVLMK